MQAVLLRSASSWGCRRRERSDGWAANTTAKKTGDRIPIPHFPVLKTGDRILNPHFPVMTILASGSWRGRNRGMSILSPVFRPILRPIPGQNRGMSILSPVFLEAEADIGE